jgi:hypothetical protein
MKAINWLVLLGFAVNILQQFLPDFPAEAMTLVVTNAVILVAYIIHKVKAE